MTGATALLGPLITAVLARRMFHLRIGTVRALLAGLAGLLAAAVAARSMGAEASDVATVTVQSGAALLGAIVFVVSSEAVVRRAAARGTTRRPGALGRRLIRGQRHKQLMGIAVRHGLHRFLSGRSRHGTASAVEQAELARSLRLALEEAGATFVKLGQMLSSRHDLLPAVFTEELSSLQHEVTPEPWPDIERVLAEELKAPPEEVFAEFSHEAIAAGSIAQVHRARLRDGRAVAVKVQRPGARQVVERDLDIFLHFSRILERTTAWGRTVSSHELVHGLADSLIQELDFCAEARNTVAVAAGARQAAAGGSPGERRNGTNEAGADAGPGTRSQVRMPEVHQELSTGRVLVVEWLDGVTLTRAGTVIDARGLDRRELARDLFGSLLAQIMIGGVFHADPHPGNVLILDDGGIGLVDFGSVGRVDQMLRSGMRDLLMAFDRNDPQALADALLQLVERPDEIDEERFTRALARFTSRHLTSSGPMDLVAFNELVPLMAEYGLTVPPEVALTFRALATLEGSLNQLAPGFDLVEEGRALAGTELTRRLSPEQLTRSVTDEVAAVLPMLLRLPRRADRISGALEKGRLSINMRLLADERDRRFIRGIVHDVLLAFFAAMSCLAGILLLSTQGGPSATESLRVFDVFGYGMVLAGSLLVLRVLFSTARAR
jgi:ubiquinone biosynthesis protein